jgi:hypothetical protein
MAVPVGIEPTMQVRGRAVELSIKLGELAITEHMIWLGANVSVKVGEDAPDTTAPEKKAADPQPPAT